jgi:predicted outer membrane repeat protein
MSASTQVLRTLLVILLPLGMLSARPAGAAIYAVGSSESGCTHHDLQDAIDNVVPGTVGNVIHVANSISYTQIAAVIDGKSIDVIGGYVHCSDAAPSTTTTLDGADNGAHSVIRVSGAATVSLENFTIQHGTQGTDSHGGGINFTGHGALTLRNDIVQDNTCGYGGGLDVKPDGAAAVTIAAGTSFVRNSAEHSGGGIHIEGSTVLSIIEGPVVFFGNSADNGYGGGLHVIGPARADIGSPGSPLFGLFSVNSAKYGGGIAITTASDGDDALVRLYATAAGSPAQISGNSASENGGGVYLDGYNTGSQSARARLCAYDFRIINNDAKDGAGIFADEADVGSSSVGADVYLNRFDDPDGICNAPGIIQDSVRCSAGANCNVIANNTATDADGSIVTIAEDGKLLADKVQIIGNQGAYALRVRTDRGIPSTTHSCLLADNTLSGAVVKTDGNSPVEFLDCTFAHNTLGGPYVFALDDDLQLYNSIIAQPGSTSVHETDGDSLIIEEYVLASEVGSLVSGPSVRLIDDARFIDPAHGDYHLQAASPAVDAGGYYTFEPTDLDGLPRRVDLPLVTDYFGSGSPADVGAYERQTVGNIALDPDFDQDLRLWSDVTPGTTAFDASENFAGAPGSGSAHVDVPRSDTPVNGLRQCIHIPGASGYALDGYALAGGNISSGHDVPSLHWRLRYNSDDCNGSTIDGEGSVAIPAGSPDWHHALTPALIDVPANHWSHDTTLEVTLVVTEGNLTIGGDTAAWFDGISLVPADVDSIFANGFERP